MRARKKSHKAGWAALGLCLSTFGAHSAEAYSRHHHKLAAAHFHHHVHIYAADPLPSSAGFGPTSPGVSSIVIDAADGQVISQSGADIPRYPASLTKLMTLDLAFQALRDGRLSLDTAIPVSYHAASVEPVKLGLQPGSTITVRQAILAMTTMSANDAATALGEYLGGGSEERCAQMMTLRAHALGMAQTEYYNASGLPNADQITTARDIGILARDIVVNFPDDQPFFEVQQFDFDGHQVYSNNQMLKTYAGATGMKTGYTDLARHNLVTSAMRNGHVLIGVELHEPSWGASYQQMTAMLDDGFDGHVDGANTLVAANQPPAVTIRASPAPELRAVSSQHHQPAASLAVASRARPRYIGGWIAQLGLYTRMSRARVEALTVEQMRGVGVPRIARVERHGRVLWTAQLAGLTHSAAHETCDVLAARGDSCLIIAPSTEHLAMDSLPADFGT
jgi:D-alanyl-D-alanine carboxypeptidase